MLEEALSAFSIAAYVGLTTTDVASDSGALGGGSEGPTPTIHDVVIGGAAVATPAATEARGRFLAGRESLDELAFTLFRLDG